MYNRSKKIADLGREVYKSRQEMLESVSWTVATEPVEETILDS